MTLTLQDFERDALSTLTRYAQIECLSPAFDQEWSTHGHIDAAVELLAEWARARTLGDFSVEVVRLEGRTPLLVVSVAATNDDDATVVLYGHLDKQPPLGQWSEGLSPYVAVRRDDRLYARGVADDGYSTFSALLALEQLVVTGVAHSRCVVVIEACEESGSPDLEAYLDHLASHLGRVELMVCLDSGAVTYDRLWVTTSLRGLVTVRLSVEVLTRAQHSGSASGIVPSSFRIVRELLDRVEDATTGRVLPAELHGSIPEHAQRAAGNVAREFGDTLTAELPTVAGLRLMGADVSEQLLNQTWRPTMSVVGIDGLPACEQAGNVLRPFTAVTLSFRLPPHVDSRRAAQALERILGTDAPSGARVTVDAHGADGWSTPPLALWLADALEDASQRAFGHSVGFTGEGGTIPFLAFLGRRYPHVQFVATGVLGPGSNAHGIDEMLDLPTAVAVTNAVADIVAAFGVRGGTS